MVMACIATFTPGRFFLKRGNVAFNASSATSHDATVRPPPSEPPPHPAAPRRAAPARPAPPSLKNRRRLMPPLTHLTLRPVDKPSPFRSTSRDVPYFRDMRLFLSNRGTTYVLGATPVPPQPGEGGVRGPLRPFAGSRPTGRETCF